MNSLHEKFDEQYLEIMDKEQLLNVIKTLSTIVDSKEKYLLYNIDDDKLLISPALKTFEYLALSNLVEKNFNREPLFILIDKF